MWNPFKKKKKWVRFYSVQKGVSALQPWIPAKKLKRKWVNDALKKYYGKDSACPVMKVKKLFKHHTNLLNYGVGDADYDGLFQHAATCPALHQLFESGWILQCPADFVIQQDGEKKNFSWISQVLFEAGGKSFVKAHAPEQTEGMSHLVNQQKETNEMVVKLELPWRVQAHKDVVFIQIPVPYHDEERFSVPTGIVDPSYSYEVNLQMFWHAVEPGEYLVKAGTPLCQWIPIPRQWLHNDEFDVIVEDANEEDLKNNEIMDYHRYMSFPEMTTLKGRIDNQKKILSLNKNKERFE